MGSKKCLVVDDEMMVRESVQACLTEAGYQSLMASDGKSALALMKADPDSIQVLILDWRMPEMDGMAVLSEMRHDAGLHSIPVIMLTAMASDGEIRQGIDAGVFYYLIKPFSPDVLSAVVAAAVRSRSRWREIQKELAEYALSLDFMHSGSFQVKTMKEAHALAMLLSQACPDPQRVVMGLCDLLSNAVEHGNLGINFEEKTRLQEQEQWEEEIERRLALSEHAEKYVDVEFVRSPESIQIIIRDQGLGFDWKPYLEFNPEKLLASHGRGIAMAKALSFDEVEYRNPGNEVVCTIRLS